MVNCYWPTSLEETLEILADGQVVPYAGGVGLMTRGDAGKGYLYLSRVPELHTFSVDESYYRVGLGITQEQLLRNHQTPDLLKTAVSQTADPALRAQITLGGSLIGSSSGAPVPLSCLVADAFLRVVSSQGERAVPLRSFYRGQGEVDLTSRELAVELLLPIDKVEPFTFRTVPGGVTLAAVIQWQGERLVSCSLGFGGSSALLRPELDKTLWNKTRGELSAELSGYFTAWENAIQTGHSSEDWLPAARKALFHDFWDTQGLL